MKNRKRKDKTPAGDGAMRTPTQAEVDVWIANAQALGMADEQGRFALGRFQTTRLPDGALALVFVTPLPAGLEGPDLEPKRPPIMFDRTADGRVIIPGRWWQHMFDQVATMDETPPEVQAVARVAAQGVYVADQYLPADTDTIGITAPDREGNQVPHEALKPGTVCRLEFVQQTDDEDAS